MADGKVVIETDLDSSGIKKGLSKLGNLTTKGLKATTAAITGTSVALEGIGLAAVKAGSDFEAQMSRVKAISGATGTEFEKLKDQAIQLGADTSFSASQAAEGMENLAAAGFNVNETLDAMPGLLDLAAASGEDLSKSSDIAASAVRGFGLEAKQTGHVADVLAANANKTNSSVSETGEAMKYVAPLARAAGLSFEETAAAIGIMANAGIQGSQAGTTLRAAISRLSNPTEDMTAAIEELGISFYDSNGKMKSLTEQVGMLQKATSGMTDEQKNNYMVTLYGQEALSGMLALMNEGEGALNDLTEAYKSCDGTAKETAKTMQDNLQGAVEQLKGSAESLGIVFYEKVSNSLKDTAETATESINNITDAFHNGGLDAAIEQAGDEFADLATKAASHAPKMAETAVHFIESFTEGIIFNKDELYNSAVDIAETLAGGLADLLPDELERPVDDAIDAIADSLNSGGLKKAGKTADATFDNLIDAAGNLAEKALPPLTKGLDFAAENLDILAASATTAFLAFKGYKVITEANRALSKGAKAWKTASAAVDAYNVIQMACTAQGVVSNATLTAGQTVVGLLTGKVSLATAAQTAWNAVMAANPIGLVITAVGALAAGIGIYTLTQEKASESTYELSKAQKEVLNSCNDVTKSIQEERTAREQNVQSIEREYGKYTSLVTELQSITDANGKVKDGYLERAKVITGQLSDALGLEIELTDGIIENYQETIDKIKEVIVQKKAEALQASMQEDMAKAYEKSEEAVNKYKEAVKVLNKTESDVKTATENAKFAKERYNAALASGAEDLAYYNSKQEQANQAVKEAKKSHEEAKKSVDDAKISMSNLAAEVNNYDALIDAMATGETAKIEAAMTALVTSYKSYNEETLASSQKTREEMYAQANGYVENLKIVQNGTVEVADSIYQQMVDTAVNSIKEFNKLPEGIAQGIEEIGPEASAALISTFAQADIDGKLDEEAKGAVKSFIDGFDGLDKETKTIWSQAWYGALEGLEGFEELKNPAEDGVEAFLESLEAALEVHSPSRAVKRIFSYVWPGASEGLEEGKDGIIEKGKSIISNFLSILGIEGEKSHGLGVNIMNLFGLGIGSQKGNIDIISKEIADSSNEQLGSADTKETGSRKALEYNEGVGSNKGLIDNTSNTLADSSNKKLGSKDTRGTGKRKGSEFNSGLGSNSGAISSTGTMLSNKADVGMGSANTGSTGAKQGENYSLGIGSKSKQSNEKGELLASEADKGARSYSGYDPGYNFGSGFVSGIGEWFSAAADAATSLASKAFNAAKKWLDEHSPSRKTRKMGKFFSEGFALGISDEEKMAVRTSKEVSQAALEAVDLSDISNRMREAMAINTSRIAKSFAIDTSHSVLNNQEINTNLQLSDADMKRLSKQFGIVAGDVFAENMEGMTIRAYDRELFRIIRKGMS